MENYGKLPIHTIKLPNDATSACGKNIS